MRTKTDFIFAVIAEACPEVIPVLALFAVTANVTPFEWLWRVGENGSAGREALSTIEIDHSVPAVSNARGGRSTSVQMWHWVVIPMIGITMGEIFYLRDLASDCDEVIPVLEVFAEIAFVEVVPTLAVLAVIADA